MRADGLPGGASILLYARTVAFASFRVNAQSRFPLVLSVSRTRRPFLVCPTQNQLRLVLRAIGAILGGDVGARQVGVRQKRDRRRSKRSGGGRWSTTSGRLARGLATALGALAVSVLAATSHGGLLS